MKNAKIIKVIKTECVVGTGSEKDPVRTIIQYWELNGKLLFTIDNYLEETISEASSEISS